MNYSTEMLWIAALAGLVLGGGLGLWLGQWLQQRSAPAKRQLERELGEIRDQQAEYQEEVSEHFSKTAQLLGQLSSSYRDVHNHLARGSERLTGSDSPALRPLPEDSGLTIDQQREQENLEPPRDYAPRNPGKGTLDESYGLDEPRRDTVQSPPTYP